ncbi:unnamed protein product [Trichobilharzia szidati]|nr:unnamed protein product [Trichobilharzia szidati]
MLRTVIQKREASYDKRSCPTNLGARRNDIGYWTSFKVDILMTSETPEQRITHVLQKVTEKTGKYFTELVETKCGALKSKDAVWFDDTIKKIISDFEKNSSDGCAKILSQYDINSKGALLAEANKTLKRRNRSWRPSGDPEKDIRAHILPLNKSFAENLSSYSRELESKVSRGLADLKKLRSTLHDEVTEFQSIAEKLQKLSKSTENTVPHIPSYHVPNRQ